MRKISLILTTVSIFFIMTVSSVFAQDYGSLHRKGVYRLNNTVTGEHLYSADTNEIVELTKQCVGNSQTLLWLDEDLKMIDQENGKPVYRLYNPTSREHLYTADENEANTLANRGWSKDFGGEPAFRVVPDEQEGVTITVQVLPVHRLYNPKASAVSSHLLTTDENEINALKGQGYVDEGIKFFTMDPAVYPVGWDSAS